MAQPKNRLWLLFSAGLLISLAGAAVLFTPTLEFAAVDLIEKLGLPLAALGNFALYVEAALLLTSLVGLITLTIRHILER